MKILLEAGPGTVDLRALFSNTHQEVTPAGAEEHTEVEADNVETSTQETSVGEWEWGDTLKNLGFQPDIISKLKALGKPFSQALKILGANPKFVNGGNPLLAFVKQKYVQEKLLSTDLLNANTFRALYNAISKRQVAHSEFFKVNDYNIIYCQALYKKSASEIAEYLEVQKNILGPTAKQYTQATLSKNKKAFFYIEKIDGIPNKINRELSTELNIEKRAALLKGINVEVKKLPDAWRTNTALNSLKLAKKVAGASITLDDTELDKSSHSRTENISKLVKELHSPADFFAALQYISLTTKVPEADEALKNAKLQNIDSERIAQATTTIKSIVSKSRISETEAKALVAVILGKMEQSL